MSFLRLLLFASLLIALAGASLGQTTTTSSTDKKTPAGLTAGSPAGSFALSGFDNINPYNGNLNFKLPLLGVGGRGSAGYTITLALNSKKWRTRYSSNTVNGEIVNETWTPTTAEWKGAEPGFSPGVLVGRQHGVNTWPSNLCNANPRMYKFTLTRLYFITPDGSEHELRDVTTNGQPQATTIGQCSSLNGYNRGKVFASVDGEAMTFVADNDILDWNRVISTGVQFIYPSGVLTLRDGTRYIFKKDYPNNYVIIRDPNGNQVKYDYTTNTVTDSLGRQVTISYGITHPNYGYSDKISYKGSGGVQRDIVVSYDSLDHLLRNTQTGDVTSPQYYNVLFPGLNGANNIQNPFNPSTLISSVWLPDGRRYRFYYNKYGELARVDLPTGGAIEYDYTPTSASVREGMSHAGTDYQIYRRVTERRVYANGTTLEGKTKFPINSAGDWTGLVQHLAPNDTLLAQEAPSYIGGTSSVESLFYPQSTSLYSGWMAGRPSGNTSYAADGATVLRTSASTWSQRAAVSWLSWWATQDRGVGYGGGDDPANDPRVTDVVTTLSDVSPSLVTKTHTDYDQYNNPTDVYEYDYGSGAAPTSYIRRTHTDYVTTNNGVNYATDTNIHLRSLPAQQQIYDASGTLRAQMSFEYDNYNQGTTDVFHAALTNRTNIVGLDSGSTTSYYTRGNVTKTTKYLLNSSGGVTGSISSYGQYDIAGNVVKTIDPRSTTSNIIATTIDYRDNFGAPTDFTVQSSGSPSNNAPAQLSGQSTFALPFSVTNALGHVAYTKYDYYLGQPVLAEDANNVKSSIYRNDALDRPTKGINAIGTSVARQTVFIYNDGLVPDNNGYPARSITTISDKDTFAESSAATPTGIKATALYDGLGRTWRTAKYEGSNNWAIVETQFDAMGRDYRSCNPFRASSPDGALPSTPEWSTKSFDALSRPISLVSPDSTHVDTRYSGNRLLVIDQASRKRISETNALGQLINVWEVTTSDSWTSSVTFPGYSSITHGYLTAYQYDTLGNLRQVTQAGNGTTQQRYFLYDSLGRLIRTKNPEQDLNGNLTTSNPSGNNDWTMGYTYDNNGNLLTRTDANNVTTTYTYDALNRVTAISYSDGTPTVNRYYDGATYGKGRFWYDTVLHANGTHTVLDSYDPLGRPVQMRQHLITPTFMSGGTVWLGYNWSPAFYVTQNYNLAGQVTTLTNPMWHTANYTYNAAGQLDTFGGSLGDGISRNYVAYSTYTPAGQLTQEKFSTTTNIYHNIQYNNRQQITDIRVGSNADGMGTSLTWNRGALRFYYDSAAAGGPGGDNNGNLYRQDHFMPGTDTVSQWSMSISYYGYDSLNRITGVWENQQTQSTGESTVFTQQYLYDRWGNRKINLGATTNLTGITKQDFKVVPDSNRLKAPTDTNTDGPADKLRYDKMGNLTKDTYTQNNYSDPKGQGTRAYDAENQIKEVYDGSGNLFARYTYNGDGKRVRCRITSGSTTTETWQIYGFDGELLAEYDYNSTAPSITYQKAYGYRGGQVLITATLGGELKWLVTDHLGSTRIVLDKSGALTDNSGTTGINEGVVRHDYLPFGEELGYGIGVRTTSLGFVSPIPGLTPPTPPDDKIRQKFTGKERDTETGMDWFSPGRYFSSTQGRFNSPDPLLSSGDNENPQSWNRYSYALNNPVRFTDPFGLYTWDASLGGDYTDEELWQISLYAPDSLPQIAVLEIIAGREYFRNGRTDVGTARDALPEGDERDLVAGSFDSYGTEGVDNGVTVGVGTVSNNAAAEATVTGFPYQESCNCIRAQVSVRLNQAGGSTNLALDVGHEGRHVADAQAFANALNADRANGGANAVAGDTNRTRYEREVRGYIVSASIARGLGLPNLVVGNQRIWDNGWREADIATRRRRAIDNHLRESPTYRLTPENPGPRYIQR